MKKILILLLLMVSTSGYAEWTAMGGDGDATAYVDFGTIKRKGNKAKMWYLTDFKVVKESEGDRYLSMIARDEYDCEEKTKRTLDLYLYSGNMKSGEIVFSQTNITMEAESIIQGGSLEALFDIGCGKK
jgi:hypothetical protein